MAKYNFVKPTAQKEDELKNDSQKCDVWGCPIDWTIQVGNTKNCRYHFRRAGNKLAEITMLLKNHSSLILWNERLFRFCLVDYDVNLVHKTAPNGLEPHQGERFQDYKLRIQEQVNNLLGVNHGN